MLSNNKCNGILVIVIFEKHLFLGLLFINAGYIARSDHLSACLCFVLLLQIQDLPHFLLWILPS